MPISFRILAGAVVSEIIDGEAVIMQMRTGHYFSTRGTGAELWDLLQRGVDLQTSARLFSDASGRSLDEIASAIDAFVADAARHQLGESVEVTSTTDADLQAMPALSAAWSAPVIEVFTDMEDLLLLDPIHDVSEEVGWPMQKPPEQVE
jgi:hypothetical protein